MSMHRVTAACPTHVNPTLPVWCRARRLAQGVLLVWGLLLTAGCGLLPPVQRPGAATPAPTDVPWPGGWTALGDWQPVNLDGDPADESLRFFRFDGGAVGALIAPLPSADALSEAVLLLPRHFGDRAALGDGWLAPPGTPLGDLHTRVFDDNGRATLLIRGGASHLTWVWGDGAGGYGVSQVVAAGGFVGVDWAAWAASPTPLPQLVGRVPLADGRTRSQLCRWVTYTQRRDVAGILYEATPGGLGFCAERVPPYPFYPEGVVLAYLLGPRPGGDELPARLAPELTLRQLDADAAFDRLARERIEDIAAYPALPVLRTPQGETVTTPVCVELAEVDNLRARRWLVFTLRYFPYSVEAQLPARWAIAGVQLEPPPVGESPAHSCAAILSRRAP
jgi:hypothetical protein